MTPVAKNTEHTVTIESVTAKGYGVGFINGFTIFVEGALPGDVLQIYVLKAKARYGYGKIINILTPSLHRQESLCPVFDRCGGCQWQNAAYNAQLAYKKKIVIDVLERIGGIPSPPVQDVLHMKNPYNYRNKAVFPIVPSNNVHGFAVGMFSARSHRIVEVENCNIQHPAHVQVLKIVKKFMRRNKITAYDETTHRGLMRFVMVRTSLSSNEVMVVLTVNGNGIPLENRLAEDLASAGVTTVVISRHTTKTNVVLGQHFRTISGSGFISERIGHVTYKVSAPSFFQVNPVQTKTLYEIAVTQAKLKGKTVMDAHVGAGGVSLFAARYAKSILGVDIVAAATEDGQKNASLNGITNLEFVCGAAEDVLPPMLTGPNAAPPDVMFLDPPRKGCEPALLEAIICAQIPRVVYISCDPATLARDIKLLCAGGYELLEAQPVDMFPHTGKVEVSCLLTAQDQREQFTTERTGSAHVTT